METTESKRRKAVEWVIGQAEAELARRDVNEFVEFVMRDPAGQPWQQAAFHREWQAMLPEQGPARVLIVAPRESAKSSQMVGRVLWEVGRDAQLRVAVVCSSDTLATKLVGEIGRNILHNRRLHLVFPQLRPDPRGPWSQLQLRVVRDSLAKEHTVEGYGIESAGVGGRADLMIFDDVTDQRNAMPMPAKREQVKRLFYETWLNLLEPEGRAVYISTVWSPSDLTVELRDSGNWQVWWRGARDELTGELLWPERWGEVALRQREAEIGSRAFARQFLVQAIGDEEHLFSPEGLTGCRDSRYVPGRVTPPVRASIYVGVDLAATIRKTGSWTVIFVLALLPDGRRLPVEIVRFQARLSEVVDRIVSVCQAWGPRKIMVESNAFQQAVLELLGRDDPELPLEGHRTGAEKADEEVGLPALAAALDRGRWIIPAGGTPHGGGCECAWYVWQRELALYPASETSDTIMAMWFAEMAARQGASTPIFDAQALQDSLRRLRRPNPIAQVFGWRPGFRGLH